MADILLAAWPGLVLAAIALTKIVLAGPAHILDGELYDADSFTHLSRLRAILADGAWHQGFFLRDNAPFGMVIHWTKPYDIYFLILAAPIALIAGWDQALHIIAPCIGPLDIGLLICTAIFAARPFCDRRECQIVGLTVALAPVVLQYGQIGDADHHIFIAALWVLTLGLMARMVLGRDRGGLSILTGLMTAFSLWTAVECILVIVLGLALLGFAWIRAGQPLRATNLRFAASFSIATTLAWLLDLPYGSWLRPDLDRLSIVYVAFALLFLVLWLLLAAMSQKPERWRARLVAAAVGGLLCATVLAGTFSGILAPERTVFIKDTAPDWTATIGEMLPAYHNLHDFLLVATVPLIALLFTAWNTWRQRGSETGLAWRAYGFVLLPIFVFGLLHTRFMGYPEIAAGIAIAKLLSSSRPSLRRIAPNFYGAAELLTAILLMLALPALGAIFWSAAPATAIASTSGDCRLQPVVAALRDSNFMGGNKQILMTSLGLAPEVIYWTDHDAVAGPYHRNVEGIRDEFAFFMSEDDATAITILMRRGITHVMICPAELRQLFPYPASAGTVTPPRLAERLIDGPTPGWLTSQPWPQGITSDIRLFRLNIAKAP